VSLLPPGVDLVVIPRQGAESLKLHEVTAEWRRASTALRRQATEALARTPEEPHVSGRGKAGALPKNRAT
jgi:hypothetical protein